MRAAIVGAGIAGLRLANRLRDLGAEVQVYEKARGPSGRLATRRSDDGQFDHGAQYFTARASDFVAQVEDWSRRGIVKQWTRTVAQIENGVWRVEPDPPLRYVGVPRMSAIGRDLAEGVSIEFSVRIDSAKKDGRKWTLLTESGSEHGGFDLVLLAVPAPQAVPLLASSPSLALRAGDVRMLACHALMVRFESQIAAPFDAAFVRSSPLGWAARDGSKPGRADGSTWVLHSAADWSEAHLDLGAEETRETLLSSFETALGETLPATNYSAVHRWLYARVAESSDGQPVWDPELGLGACGDWLQGDRVEDAYLSAETLADAIQTR